MSSLMSASFPIFLDVFLLFRLVSLACQFPSWDGNRYYPRILRRFLDCVLLTSLVIGFSPVYRLVACQALSTLFGVMRLFGLFDMPSAS